MPGNRGPKIPTSVKRRIMDTALGSAMPRTFLAEKLRGEFLESGLIPPTTETIERWISYARNHEDPEGEAWSLGASRDWSTSPDVTKALLNIWWWCRVVGRSFTIREAKWVVRFWGTVPNEKLLYWASMYARRERVSKLLQPDRAAYTDDLDASLGLDVTLAEWWNWGPLYIVAEATETVPTSGVGKLREMGKLPIQEQAKDQLRQRIVDFVDPGGDSEWLEYPAGAAVEYRLDLSCDHAAALPKSVDAIYAMWLRKLSTCPRWPDISREARHAVARRLHDEVATWWEKRQKETSEIGDPPFANAEDYEKAMEWYFGISDVCRPSNELFDMVGMAQEKRGERDERLHQETQQE